MSEDNTIDTEPKEIEYDIEELKIKADLLGVSYNPRIGGKKLKAKIDLHMSEIDTKKEEVTETKTGAKSIGPNKTVRQLEKEARRLISVIVTDNNPIDIDNPTIVIGVENSYFKIGPVIIRKDEEQLIPKAILASLKAKTMVKWVPSINTMTKRPTGNKIAERKSRYNIQYL